MTAADKPKHNRASARKTLIYLDYFACGLLKQRHHSLKLCHSTTCCVPHCLENEADDKVSESYMNACTSYSLKSVCFLFCNISPTKTIMHEMRLGGGDGGESAALINGSCMGC